MPDTFGQAWGNPAALHTSSYQTHEGIPPHPGHTWGPDGEFPYQTAPGYSPAGFMEDSGLQQPSRNVQGPRPPYVCPLCGKGFVFKEHFEGHMNVHNNIKAFKCPYCPREYAYKTSLRLHINRACKKAPRTSAVEPWRFSHQGEG
ncbi:hypothetical protein ACOMHN_028566 [Nucella lapillus]